MKKITSIFLVFVLAMLTIGIIPANAATEQQDSTYSVIEKISEDYYIETVIEDVPSSFAVNSTTSTVTKTKTTYGKNSSGEVMWSVSITATFTYNGSTSTCTSCTPSASAPGSCWAVKSLSSTRGSNSATAYALLTYSNGSLSQDYSVSVTISCDANGVVS